jgi:hypothetical protein
VAQSEYTINLYISTSSDYLRPNEGSPCRSFTSATTAGARTSWDAMPKILAPMPQTGSESQFKAFYFLKVEHYGQHVKALQIV